MCDKSENKDKTEGKGGQTCSRQSCRSASATHVATVATSLQMVYIEILKFACVGGWIQKAKNVSLFFYLTYTNSSRHGTTWKSIRTVSIDMAPPGYKWISVFFVLWECGIHQMSHFNTHISPLVYLWFWCLPFDWQYHFPGPKERSQWP